MRIYKIIKNTSVEGPGKRFCIWVQGCSRHCRGCFAKETWDFSAGKEYNVQNIYAMIKSQKGIEGVTFLGGEPFEQVNELYELSKLIKKHNLSIVCFTGYRIEDLMSKNNRTINQFLANIDLLIDGEFKEEKIDFTRPWIGSSNQRYIFLSDRYKESEIMKYRNKIEMHIYPDGEVLVNGMGNFDLIEKKLSLQPSKNNVK